MYRVREVVTRRPFLIVGSVMMKTRPNANRTANRAAVVGPVQRRRDEMVMMIRITRMMSTGDENSRFEQEKSTHCGTKDADVIANFLVGKL